MTVKGAGKLSAIANSVGKRLKSKASRLRLPSTFVTYPRRSAMAGQN